ncbi:MAG: tRNA epoxyqueuosine(34) reductase QueG [Pseudomonadota bacterium]
MRELKQIIRNAAKKNGLFECGFARARRLDDDARRLSSWIAKGRHGAMGYMARTADIRPDPSHEAFFPGAKTVFMAAAGYGHPPPPDDSFAAAIARYARGRDYHGVMRGLMEGIVEEARRRLPDLSARVFVDTAPVMEKPWARMCGIGWIGKNSLIVTRSHGSFLVLGGFVTGLELEPDEPAADMCGSCTACIEACPTGAIHHDRTIDAGRCISHCTTETSQIDDEKLRNFVAGRSVFGCDICQQACPFNEHVPNGIPALRPFDALCGTGLRELAAMDIDKVRLLLKDTAMERPGPGRILQNARCYLGGGGAGGSDS